MSKTLYMYLALCSKKKRSFGRKCWTYVIAGGDIFCVHSNNNKCWESRYCDLYGAMSLEQFKIDCRKQFCNWFALILLRFLFNQSRGKPKPIMTCPHAFPALGVATCICFELWLVHWIVCVCCDWPDGLLWLWFYDIQLKTAPDHYITSHLRGAIKRCIYKAWGRHQQSMFSNSFFRTFSLVLLQPEDKPMSKLKLTARKPGLFSISTRHHIPASKRQASAAVSNQWRQKFRDPGPSMWHIAVVLDCKYKIIEHAKVFKMSLFFCR